ncbi:hypothetical protein LXL04_033691 [Taraxacum kok-saghyz]
MTTKNQAIRKVYCFKGFSSEIKRYYLMLGANTHQTFFFWSPSIKRTFTLSVPVDLYMTFGVCAETFDPKLLTSSDVSDIVIDGYSYCVARLPNEHKIVSFNFTTQTFETMDFRDGLVFRSHHRIFEIMGFVAIIQMVGHMYNVWILDVSWKGVLDTPHELNTCTKNASLIMVESG